jgi:hypothetical protein
MFRRWRRFVTIVVGDVLVDLVVVDDVVRRRIVVVVIVAVVRSRYVCMPNNN